MRATLAACAVVAAGFGAAVAATTGGLSHWTLESSRRAQARAEGIAAPDVALQVPDAAPRPFAPVGQVQVVDFIYTRCPTVCLSLGTAFQRMQAEIGTDPAQRPVRLLSVSFDTDHDRPADLAAYAARHRADPGVWTVAVPASTDGTARLLRALGVVAIDDGLGGYVHNGSLHVVDTLGRVRAIHDHADWPRALADAARLARESP